MKPMFTVSLKDGLATLVIEDGHQRHVVYSVQQTNPEGMERMRRSSETLNSMIRCRQNAVVERCAKVVKSHVAAACVRLLKEAMKTIARLQIGDTAAFLVLVVGIFSSRHGWFGYGPSLACVIGGFIASFVCREWRGKIYDDVLKQCIEMSERGS